MSEHRLYCERFVDRLLIGKHRTEILLTHEDEAILRASIEADAAEQPHGECEGWQQFRRTNIAEMRPYVPGEDLSGVSVSDSDMSEVASGALGGMIARNPRDHADQWYVAADYFRDNFAAMAARGALDESEGQS